MYLHVGNNKIIREKSIIGIFDADNATVSAITKKYLSDAQKDGLLETCTDELPKSFIMYSDAVSDFAEKGKYKICFSQISSSALFGRLQKSHFEI